MFPTSAAVWPWPIVIYLHHIGSPLDHYTSMSTHDFVLLLDLVQSAGDVVDLDQVAPDNSVRPVFALTFDDGYAETFDAVLPILEHRQIPATFFVVPGWFGTQVEHDWAPGSALYASVLQVQDAATRGFGIASHTWSHRSLTELTVPQVSEEIDRSAVALSSSGLGSGLDGTVAYPYGRIPSVIPTSVRRGFSTVKAAAACWECRPLAIRRVYLDAANTTEWKATIDYWSENWLLSRDHSDCPHYRPA